MPGTTAHEVVESPLRRRLHLISGSVVLTVLYAGVMLAVRNLVG